MSYESPIKAFLSDIQTKIKEAEENYITEEVSRVLCVDIDKNELMRALNYDRGQYRFGYMDAKIKYEGEIRSLKADVASYMLTSEKQETAIKNLSFENKRLQERMDLRWEMINWIDDGLNQACKLLNEKDSSKTADEWRRAILEKAKI